jgi:ADP-heptose:LPS heptosyltransferase
MKRILVVKRDKIGDMLLTTPLFAHLRAARPELEVHVLANDYNAWVLEGNPDIDRLWVYPRARQAGRLRLTAVLREALQVLALRRMKFDAVLVGNSDESPRAIQRGLRVGAARTVAYCQNPARYPGLTDPLPPVADRHECDSLIALATPLGIASPVAVPLPRYVLPASSQEAARRWLEARGLAPGGYVVIGLGARRPKKKPTAEQVRDWSLAIKREFGLDSVLFWTPGPANDPLYPGDDELAQAALAIGPDCLQPCREAVSTLIGVIWQARTSLFPDSGLMHFAAASPGGVLGFFADTDVSANPLHWGPRGRNVALLEAEKSVADIPDAAVMEKLAVLLAGAVV